MNSSNQVKQLRLQRAWSQEQLAELAGVSVRTIQRIENGDRPGLETLSALAAVFEVNVAEISGACRTRNPFLPFTDRGGRGLRPAGGAELADRRGQLLVRMGGDHLGGVAGGKRITPVCVWRMDQKLASGAAAAAAAKVTY